MFSVFPCSEGRVHREHAEHRLQRAIPGTAPASISILPDALQVGSNSVPAVALRSGHAGDHGAHRRGGRRVPVVDRRYRDGQPGGPHADDDAGCVRRVRACHPVPADLCWTGCRQAAGKLTGAAAEAVAGPAASGHSECDRWYVDVGGGGPHHGRGPGDDHARDGERRGGLTNCLWRRCSQCSGVLSSARLEHWEHREHGSASDERIARMQMVRGCHPRTAPLVYCPPVGNQLLDRLEDAHYAVGSV